MSIKVGALLGFAGGTKLAANLAQQNVTLQQQQTDKNDTDRKLLKVRKDERSLVKQLIEIHVVLSALSVKG